MAALFLRRHGGQLRAGEKARTGSRRRETAIEAARLHAMERVLSAVGNKIVRDIESS
jgi:hypothetical protein